MGHLWMLIGRGAGDGDGDTLAAENPVVSPVTHPASNRGVFLQDVRQYVPDPRRWAGRGECGSWCGV
jgi:hypothetical protein